jgi:hypothetical protein
MLIKSLEKMEKIVAKNKNLIWHGWDIIDLKESPVAKTSPSGIRVNDKWYIHKKYVPSRNGWEIPNKYKA